MNRVNRSTMCILTCAAMVPGMAYFLDFKATAQPLEVECAARSPARNPDCGQHNMMALGEQSIFVSHLPMFHNQHRYQVIMAIELQRGGASRNAVYTSDRRRNPTVGMYTIEPQQEFLLKRLFAGDGGERRTGFTGTVFRGHLERGGQPVDGLTRADVKVRSIVYAREIGNSNAPARPSELTYILFGEGTEFFLAHQIVRPPDFDQLLRVKLTGHAFTADEIARGVIVKVAGRADTAAARLRRGENVAGMASVAAADGIPIKIAIAAEPYFEEGELANPVTFKPTALEQEAGFGNRTN